MVDNYTQQQFEKFTQELTALSRKYGVILDCIGGVSFIEPGDECLKTLCYTSDASSGDLEAVLDMSCLKN